MVLMNDHITEFKFKTEAGENKTKMAEGGPSTKKLMLNKTSICIIN